MPFFDFYALSEESVRRLQELLEVETGHPWRPLDARLRGIELLELTAMLADPVGWEYWKKHPPFAVVPEPEFESVPIPQAFPIKLDLDHDVEIRKALAMLEDELRQVKRRPTHWRWAIVALYEALGHALAKHRPASYVDDPRPGQLLRLFDAVAAAVPQRPEARMSVKMVDRLRTACLPRGVTRWPVKATELVCIVADCDRVVRQLLASTSTKVYRSDGCHRKV